MNTTTTISNAPAQNKVTESQQEKTLKQTVFDCANVLLCHHQHKFEGQFYQVMLSAMEQPLLVAVLEACYGNQTKAAKVLSLSRGTLRRKLKFLGMNKNSRADSLNNSADELKKALSPMRESVLRNVQVYLANMQGQTITDLYRMVLSEVDEPLLMAVMAEVRNNRTRAAKLIGISRGTMHKKLRLCGLGV